ncbi:uncharacterized protein LY89DRAFT_726809 [Mollisia scopiformis]|uniref:SMP-30/Gluconolactonase/LRE-like region domain-containing protein n=1 Tax=Mollisia scopiformis TaxID=149040 RepID=A0A194XUN5_MOLSC|nr:uncharacterized protein LY89DRAFT_726809 [Mollisia scopiformis]KUJ23749.1 hypothetical protein LY89DRAFT_726809 [Mollisia scopiformis]
MMASKLLLLNLVVPALSEIAHGVFIPSTDSFLLPSPFQGDETVPTNGSTNFINTVTANASTNALLDSAINDTYYAFDEEFYDILGTKTPNIQLIETRKDLFAYEAGAWDYDKNQVWFSSCVISHPTYISILDLNTNDITTLDIPALYNINPNGGYYFNGTMYFTTVGNESVPNGVYAINTETYKATPIINSFYGEKYQSVDDLTWVKQGSESCVDTGPNLFFSTLDVRLFGVYGAAPLMLQDWVYRYSPKTRTVQGAISRSDIVSPNGVRRDATGRYLYVTGLAAPFAPTGSQGNQFNSSVVYRFTLDEDCVPIEKRLVAMVPSYADGLHIDDFGRIWTGEWEGITVRSPSGKVLGVFNREALVTGVGLPPMANFSITGDKLVILALDRVFVLQLGQNVTSAKAGTQ